MVLRTIGPRITGPWDLGCLGSKVRGPKVRGSKALGLIILEPQQSAPDPIICNQRPTNQLQSTGDLSRPMSMTMGHSEIVSKLSESEEEMVGVHVQTLCLTPTIVY